ncbi:MAG: pirin family protein, partial [Deltaproteobacteria bacterium]|nr:pirin family protein [Deltaproteobacteria bacterium]
PNHPHANMEILTYVLEGVLAHRDSQGAASQLRAGDVQLMSAGTGIVHSEVNPSSDERLHLYQIWIEPNRSDGQPGYHERSFAPITGRLQPIASPDEREDSLPILQDAVVSVLRLDSGARFDLAAEENRHRWVQIARGEGSIGGHEFEAGDGIAISREGEVELSASTHLETLVFDLA